MLIKRSMRHILKNNSGLRALRRRRALDFPREVVNA